MRINCVFAALTAVLFELVGASPTALAREVLRDPSPSPSGGSGVEAPPVGPPRWVDLEDFVPGHASPLLRSDPVVGLDSRLELITPPPRIQFDGAQRIPVDAGPASR